MSKNAIVLDRMGAVQRAMMVLQTPKEEFNAGVEAPPEEEAPVAPPPGRKAPAGIVDGEFDDGGAAEEEKPQAAPPMGDGPGVAIAADFVLPFDVVTQSIGIVAARGSGKALALDTPIPTPDGWTTMGDIQAGDRVFNENGEVCTVVKVTGVMRGHQCYRVTFGDGSEIVADAEHLWLTDTIAYRQSGMRSGRIKAKVVTTETIRETLRLQKGRKDLNHSVRCTKPLDLPTVDLPIHPYVLGSWLGNGTAQNSSITTMDLETLEIFRGLGYQIGEGYNPSESGKSATYRIGKGPDGVPLQTHLRKLGLLMNKNVPAIYMRASIEQRKALLSGLMDTDGTIGTQNNMVTFGNMNRDLAESAAELARSLGWVSRIGTRRAKLNGVDYGEFYNVSFRPTENVFRVQRKARRVRKNVAQISRHTQRMIVSVEPVPSVPVRCIAVDSPSHLYLAGRAMIPTHNTYLTAVMAEEFLLAGLPFVVIDPVGVYWGLRTSADGKEPGLTVYILGGDHGDVPLDPGSGKAIARWLVDYRRPAVLDISIMRKAEQRQFVADLAEELYAISKLPLHLIVDEADLFIPQRASPEEKRVLAAFEDIVRRGRVRGLGITVVTQRPAVIHKDILTQIGTLIVLRMLGPQDRKSIEEWIKFHGDPHKQRIVLSSLASLPIGTAWVWSPGWLGVLKRIAVRKKFTFDSSITPKANEEPPPAPECRVEFDIDELRQSLSDALSHDPNDPAAMKARIAELEAALAEGGGGGEGSSIVGKLQRRIAELEKRLLMNAPKIKSFDPVAFVSYVEQIAQSVRRIETKLAWTEGTIAPEPEAKEPEPEAPKKRKRP